MKGLGIGCAMTREVATSEIRDLLLAHRVVWLKTADGHRRLDRDAARIGLGYDKLVAVLNEIGDIGGHDD